MIGVKFADQIENMPTPSHKINEVVNSILDRKNAVCMIHESVVADSVFKAIAKRCKSYGIENIMECDTAGVEGSPRLYFQRRAGLNISSLGDRINVDKIMESQDCPELIILRNIDELDEESIKLWILFIHEWGKASHIYKSPFSCRRSLLMDMRSVKQLGRIVHEPGWDVHWMYKWIFPLESMITLKELLLESELDDGPGMWLEALLPEIAGPDLELMNRLFDRREELKSFEEIYSCLVKYAQENNFTDREDLSKLYSQVKSAKISNGSNVPEKLWPFWEAGLLDYVRDEGVFFNSAFLTVVGEREILMHRAWKGMVRSLLPSIDYTKVMICNWLRVKYEREWIDFCRREAQNDEKMYGVELESAKDPNNHVTELRGILNFMAVKGLHKSAAYSRFYYSIKYLRDSRNILAHGKLLDKCGFIRTIEECDNLKVVIEL